MERVAEILQVLARDVRKRTLSILDKAEAPWLTRTVPGTANHMIWHAGHALWVQDAICIVLLSGKSQLPAGWAQRFGMESKPGADNAPWPAREVMVDLLTRQLAELLRLIAAADPETLGQADPRDPTKPGVGGHIVHGFHDEAIHQGEMLLLFKMFRTQKAGAPA